MSFTSADDLKCKYVRMVGGEFHSSGGNDDDNDDISDAQDVSNEVTAAFSRLSFKSDSHLQDSLVPTDSSRHASLSRLSVLTQHSSSSSPSPPAQPWLRNWPTYREKIRSLLDLLIDVTTRATIVLADFIRRQMRREVVRKMLDVLRRAGHYLAYFTLIAMLALIPNVLYNALKDRKLDLAAFKSAGVMTCGTVILSFRLVYLHLTHWYMPEVQKYVVRILWMVPLYSVQSWLSLRFHNSRIYIDTVRDLYEAYVIASFVYYLIALLGGQDSLVQILLHKTDTELGQHPWPLSYILEPWELGEDFMLQCKHGVLQYVVLKVIVTVLTYAFESVGMYCEGTFNWKVAYPYICFFQNVSVMYALYCLVMLYNAVKEELQYPINWNPLGKFLCVKGVIFFCWWQGILIFWLRAHGVIGGLGDWSSDDVAYGLIDYCIVIEMVGFAIAHSYTFTFQEYLPENLPSQPERESQESSVEYGGTGESQTLISYEKDFENDDDPDNCDFGCLQRTYRPPATLERPMKFKEALWTSANPKDTIEDIQEFRKSINIDARIENFRPPALFRPASTSQESSSQQRIHNDQEPDQEVDAGFTIPGQSFVQRIRTGMNIVRRSDTTSQQSLNQSETLITVDEVEVETEEGQHNNDVGDIGSYRANSSS